MRDLRLVSGSVLLLAAIAVPRLTAATTSDSSYASRDLLASTTAPWQPASAVSATRPWEATLRFPGRVVSLPFVAMGRLTERSLRYAEDTNLLGSGLALQARSKAIGIETGPASLGDHTGRGGVLRGAPPRLDRRVLLQVNATANQYNRERVTGFLGPLGLLYTSEWRPRELYFGPGLTAPLSGRSAYAEQSQSARLVVAWGWQDLDSSKIQPAEPEMFRDGVRARGPRHRTWVSAWAGPRERAATGGRDPGSPSFELVHPEEAAGSRFRRVEHFTYGAGLSHDARRGRPHWSSGWRASVEGERYDRSIRALALDDAHTGARSFSRLSYRAETGVSFGRDARTLRLELRAVDQRLDKSEGTFLLGELQPLGGSAGLRGFEAGRFRDSDLALARLSYIFPLAKNLEFDVHAESGGVYPGLRQASFSTFRNSAGFALRVRSMTAMLGAVGCDWSSEQGRIWFSLGGIE
jgi:hypothetical protein